MNSIIFKKIGDDRANDLAYEMYSKKDNIVLQSTGAKNRVIIFFSGHGLMAILFGIILHASSYALSPQMNHHEYNKDHEIDYYNEWVDDSNVLKYMNLKSYIDKYTGNLFYWYPAKCKEEQRQYNSIKSCENFHFLQWIYLNMVQHYGVRA